MVFILIICSAFAALLWGLTLWAIFRQAGESDDYWGTR